MIFTVQSAIITNGINVYCANATSKRSHFASEFSTGEAFAIRSENIPEITDFLAIEIPLIFFGIIGYPRFLGTAYGFLSRGCPRGCGFCIVSGKEGRKSVKAADLSEFWDGQEEIKLMDANLLACPDHEQLLEQLVQSRALVDFTQGLDIRLISRDNVSLLNRVRVKAVHFAWDDPYTDLTEYFRRFVEWTAIRSDRNRRVYVLTNYGSTHEQDLYRVNTLRKLGYDPYVMIYERPTAPRITRHLQRWVNNKRIFHSVADFNDYAPVRKEAR